MPNNKDRRSLQALYPEPQTRSGMDARMPIQFTIPIIKLFLLLFLPPYAITAITSLYMVIEDPTSRAVYFMVFMTAIMAIGVISLVLLLTARTILVRNSVRSLSIFALYFGLVLLVGWLFISQFTKLFKGVTIGQSLAVEAVVFGVIVLAIVLLARRLSR